LNQFSTEYPCLALSYLAFTGDLVVGSLDGTVSEVGIWSGRVLETYGKHDDAVQAIYIVDQLIYSVSYDSTVKLWDRRTGSSVFSLNLGAKVVCSDMAYPNLVVGLSNQKFQVIPLTAPSLDQRIITEQETTMGVDSPLSDVSISKDGAVGFGSSCGKSAITWVKQMTSINFTMNNTYCFKAHKLSAGQTGNNTNRTIHYPVNAVGMHPKNKSTYFTAGRDGCIHFWDITRKIRTGGFSWNGVPITKAKWSPDGKYLAYGVGYDWSEGIEGAKSHKTKFCVHTVQENWLAKP